MKHLPVAELQSFMTEVFTRIGVRAEEDARCS